MNGHNNARERMDQGRYDELKGILEERRREIMSEVQGRMRDVRAEGAGSTIVSEAAMWRANRLPMP